MDKKIKRYYLMPGVWATVTNSQVFNWIRLINEKGISTDCLSMTNNKIDKEAVNDIETAIGGKFYQIRYNRYLISDFYLFCVFFYMYLKAVFKYDKIIFQTRLPKIGIPFRMIGLFYKVKIIYEARGAITEERSHVSRNRKVKNFKFRFKTGFINYNEKLFIKASDQVICVSKTLMNYYKKKYNLLNSSKFNVFPGAADNSLFYFDPISREALRKELNYSSSDIVVIYSGKLKKEWEIPDDVFKFMSSLMSYDNKFKFLVLTPDVELANQYMGKYKIEGASKVLKAKFEDVNSYLNAADISLMLREDVLMNNVASPTKFSEYMLSGIPCIMSNGVYDFAEIIEQTGFGLVVSSLNSVEKNEYDQIIKLICLDRQAISDWGKKKLSKEIMVSRYHELLNNV